MQLFCREENVAFEDFIRVKASFLLIHEYLELFDVIDTG